jgi:spore maturation protein CgeB
LLSKRDINLKIYGPNWGKVGARSILRRAIHGSGVGPEDMAKALYYAKVSLGFLCKENRDDYTQRTFEIPACKGVLVAERTRRHLQFYKEGIEAEFFESSNYDEMVQKVDRLLAEEEYRENLRQHGHDALVANGHTYEDRLKRLFELYNRHRGPSRSFVQSG